MPVNKNALIRYRTIDECLANRQRRWTLDDLVAACSKALSDYEGKTSLSLRTVQSDIQNMRSGKLGYEAPIVVVDRKFYTYSDPHFSIARMPVSKAELEQLNDAVSVLRQFAGFQQFATIEEVVSRLEKEIDVRSKRREEAVALEQNRQLRGLDWLTPLHRYIVEKKVLRITYQAFSQPAPIKHDLHPYLLKEYNNRWYLIAYNQLERQMKTLSIDRIQNVLPIKDALFIPNTFFDPDEYFQHIIGVTVYPDGKPVDILLYVLPAKVPYIETKPYHRSQECVKVLPNGGAIFKLHLMVNFELINTLMRDSPDIVVLAPIQLRNRIIGRFQKGLDRNLDTELRANLWKALNVE